MKLIMLIFVVSLMISVTMLMLTLMISKKSILDFQKSSPFECGFNPLSMKRLPFSINFFMIAIIFLIFDIEIIILLPSLMSVKMCLMKFWLVAIMLFFVILISGLYYEWMNGLLDWKN